MSSDQMADAMIAQICAGVDATNAAAGRRMAEYPQTITIVDEAGVHHFVVDRTPRF